MFQSFSTSLRPVLTSSSWYRRSWPRWLPAAQKRSASAPYLSMTSSGSYLLKTPSCFAARSRFENFLPFSLRPQPEIMTWSHGMVVVVQVRLHERVEEPGADDLERLHAQGHRQRRGRLAGRASAAQFALICGVIDDVIHVSMTSGSPVNAVPPHFAHASTGGAALERVDGQLLVGREHGFAAAFAEPDRERNAVEALPRDVPVVLEALDPAVEAHLHVVGVPRELGAACEQLVGEVEDADEPVRSHLELDRALRALGHGHLLLDLLRTAERAGGFEVGDDALARGVDVEARRTRRRRRSACPRDRCRAAARGRRASSAARRRRRRRCTPSSARYRTRGEPPRRRGSGTSWPVIGTIAC